MLRGFGWARRSSGSTQKNSNRFRLFSRTLSIGAALALFAPMSFSAVHNLSATDQGWYNSGGAHTPTNTNTITGGIGANEYRSWYKFTLPAECEDGVQSAEFTLVSVFGSRGSGPVPHSVAINDVSQANIAGLGVTTPSVTIFNDLGNGTVGTANIPGNGNFNITVVLNAAALSALETAAGTGSGEYGLGFQHLALSGTHYVMGYSNASVVTAGLKLDCSPSATITLMKTVTNDNGGTAVASDFVPSINGTATNWGTAVTLVPGSYTASESTISGYSSGDWGGDCAANGSINLGAGQAAVCTIQNDDIAARLTLKKQVINNYGGTALPADFIPSVNGSTTTWGTVIALNAGAHTVSESTLTGYSAGPWQGDCNPDGSITLVLDQDAGCSIINSDLGVNLEIEKSVSDMTPSIGDVVIFTLKVSNTGPDIATNVDVSDVIPAGFNYQAGSIAGADARNDSDPSGSGLTWTINTLTVGPVVTLVFSATVLAP